MYCVRNAIIRKLPEYYDLVILWLKKYKKHIFEAESNSNLLEENTNAELFKIAHRSKIYGPGDRDVIWFKGCTLHCKNCINPELWSFEGAKQMDVDSLIKLLTAKGVTFLGGEPLQQVDILPLVKKLKKKRIGIILFTGYEQHELDGDKKKAANLCDVVIYRRYVDKLKDDSLYLRGSLNQEIVFNTRRYKPNDFIKPNSYELKMDDDLELHGRNKELINELLELNR